MSECKQNDQNMVVYDPISDIQEEIRSHKTVFEGIIEQFSSINEKIKSLLASMEEKDKYHRESENLVKKKVRENIEKIESVDSSVSDLKKCKESMQQSISIILQSMKKHSDELSEKAHSKDIASIHSKIKECKDSSESLRSSFTDRLVDFDSELQSKQQKIETKIAELQYLNEKLIAQLRDISKRQEDHEATMCSELEKRSQFLKDKMTAHAKELNSRVDSIQVPRLEDISSEVQKTCSAAIDAFLIDIKNCVAKTNNSDMRVSILEKKLEQLSLLMKKFELTRE